MDVDSKLPPDLLRSFLSGRDVPCPQCEYNLRDLMGTRCPECGEEIVLRVNLAEPKQRLLIAGLVGLSAGAGLNGLLLIYLAIQILRGPFVGARQEEEKFLSINGMGLLVEGAAMAIWLIQWRRIRRLSLGTRTLLAFLCWVLTLLDIVLFSFLIR